MDKSCMNCMRMMPIYDGTEIVGGECMNNAGMRVNRRMFCEEWRSNDIHMAFDKSKVKTRKQN